jgi:TolB-like protein/tetratricopeptide (TPR) repeat protein
VRFGTFEVDLRAGELWKSGRRRKLTGQQFSVLAILLERPGEVISRGELQKRLWPDTFVDVDHNLNTAINKIREALNDSTEHPHYVETLSRRGYRFIAPVENVRSAVPSSLAAVSVASGAANASGLRDEGFWIAVLPFKSSGDLPDLAALAQGITEDIITGLSRFSYLRVISLRSTSRYTSGATDMRTAGKELGARYVMEGTLRQVGARLRLAVQLVDAESGALLWAEAYDRVSLPDATFELQDDLVPQIVSTVADTHGVLPRSMGELLRTRDPARLSPYEAVLRSFAHFQRVTAEEHAPARKALERAVQQTPSYADGWAMLSLIYKEEFTHGFNLRPDPLGRAFTAAQRAVEAAPSNHLAHHALAAVHFFRKDLPAFRIAAHRAIELNPLDGFTLAFLGFLIAYSGDWERGGALSAKARSLNPHHPGWYWFVPCFDAYRKRDYRTALEFARKVNMPAFWRTNLALAAASAQLDDLEAARSSLRALLAQRPEFPVAAREELAVWWEADLVEHLIEGLHRAGLQTAEPTTDSRPARVRKQA